MFLLTATVYLGSVHVPWQFDDYSVIVENEGIRDLARSLARVASSTRSVVHLTFAVNYALGGLDPWGYHLVNLSIHLLAVGFLYLWLRSVLAATDRWLAFFIALLFAVHPLTVQSVTYVTQRYSSMCGMFFFASLGAWARFRSTDRLGWLVLSLTAALAAMFCKEMAVAVPLALLGVDLSIHARERQVQGMSRRRRWLPLVPTLLLILVVPLLTMLSSAQSSEELSVSLNWAPGTAITREMYFCSQTRVILYTYLRLMVLPVGLSVDHAFAVVRSLGDPAMLPAGFILLVLLGSSCWAAFRASSPRVRLAGFGGLLFFLGLGATSTLVPNTEFVQEQRTYVSLAGLVLMAVLGLCSAPASRRVCGVVLFSLAVTMGVLTFERNKVWQSDLTLWQDAVAKQPTFSRAYSNLGRALAAHGRFDEAISHYEEALRRNPFSYKVHTNLGAALAEKGLYDQALEHYTLALRDNSETHVVQNNIGDLLIRQGKFKEALPHLEEALRLRSTYAEACNNMGRALMHLDRFGDAQPYLEKAVAHDATSYMAYSNLGIVLDRAGQHGKAAEMYQAALRVNPRFAEGHNNLGVSFRDSGRLDLAENSFRQALRLRPVYFEAYRNLGEALAGLGRTEEAIRAFEAALHIAPSDTQARAGLEAAKSRQVPAGVP